MNKLAFRIYDPENKCFHYSGSTPSMLSGYFKETATLVTVHGIKHQPATGLHDKNGVEIYEGDIVKLCDTNPVLFKVDCLLARYGYKFVFKHLDDGSIAGSYFLDKCDVIGNIHDNQELLSNTGGA